MIYDISEILVLHNSVLSPFVDEKSSSYDNFCPTIASNSLSLAVSEAALLATYFSIDVRKLYSS